MDTSKSFSQLNRTCGLLIFLWCVLLAGCNPVRTSPASAPAPTPAPQTTPTASPIDESESPAIITYITGTVWLESALSQSHPPGLLALVAQQQPPAAQRAPQRRAAPLQPLHNGDRVQVAKGASVTFVCRNNKLYRVTGQTSVLVNGQTCGSGQALPAKSAAAVKPNQGRVRKVNGSAVIEGETRERESDYGQLPIIISPRNTSVLDPNPLLTWVEVSGSSEYVLSLSGLAAFDDIVVDAESLTCGANAQTAPNRVCSLPWPAQWTLDPDQRYFLTISARTGIAAPLRPSEASALRTLPADAAAQVQAEAATLHALKLDPVTQNYLLAGLYAEHGLFDAAITAYVEAEASQPIPVPTIALGDLYLQVKLQRFAFNAYQRALDELPAQDQDDPAVHAAAEFGIGLVYYSRANYKEAESHFVTAQGFYTQSGGTAQLKDVQAALDAIHQRLP